MRKKPSPKLSPADAARSEDARAAQLAATKRKFCNFAKVWRICGSAACRRAHDCRGDAEACFARLWAAEPEEGKVWFRALVKAYLDLRDVRAAVKAATAEVERHREWTARLEARNAASSEAVAPLPEKPAQAPAPRLRGL